MKNYLAYLHHIGFSHKNLFRIFGDNENYKDFYENFWYKDLVLLWFQNEKIEKIIERRNTLSLQRIDNVINKLEVKIIIHFEKDYPESLKNISNPPFLIYVRWILRSDINLLAIVGSRKCTKYSEAVLEKFIPELVKNSFWIVSGWAYWVDSLSHKIAISNNWYTITVSWTWIDSYYPYLNRQLFENIIESWWAIISIFPILGEVWQYNFPIRNEIIAWMSLWTLITEASMDSWTLITARLALELNKDVFVVPWDITKISSFWSNSLIKDWLWKFCISSEDILEEYRDHSFQTNLFSIKAPEINNLEFSDETEKNIYNLLLIEPNNSSVLSQKLDLDIDIVNMRLTILEIKWYIKLDFWGIYRTY